MPKLNILQFATKNFGKIGRKMTDFLFKKYSFYLLWKKDSYFWENIPQVKWSFSNTERDLQATELSGHKRISNGLWEMSVLFHFELHEGCH